RQVPPGTHVRALPVRKERNLAEALPRPRRLPAIDFAAAHELDADDVAAAGEVFRQRFEPIHVVGTELVPGEDEDGAALSRHGFSDACRQPVPSEVRATGDGARSCVCAPSARAGAVVCGAAEAPNSVLRWSAR